MSALPSPFESIGERAARPYVASTRLISSPIVGFEIFNSMQDIVSYVGQYVTDNPSNYYQANDKDDVVEGAYEHVKYERKPGKLPITNLNDRDWKQLWTMTRFWY